MAKKKHLKVLFIGNSHTYYHDLPAWVALMAREEGYECDVTMLAHGGWYLRQHVKEPDVRFNIKYGHYDYVVLQEHSHPFDDIPGYIEAATTLSGWIREAGSKPVIYGTWARKTEKHVQETMNKVWHRIWALCMLLSENPGGDTKRAGRRSKCTMKTEHMRLSAGSSLRQRLSGSRLRRIPPVKQPYSVTRKYRI